MKISGGALIAQNFLGGIRLLIFGPEEPEIGFEGTVLENFGQNFEKKWTKNAIEVNFGKNLDSKFFSGYSS